MTDKTDREADTKPGTKLARLVADGVQARLEAMLQQPEVLDTLASRIANEVRAAVQQDLREIRSNQLAYEMRQRDHERRIANLESVVHSVAFQRFLRFAAATVPPDNTNEDTIPPPDTVRG